MSAQFPGLDDHQLERIFYIGFNREMKEPHGLCNYIAVVLKMESSTFCRILGDASKGATKQQNVGSNNNVRMGGYYNNNQKVLALDAKPQKENIPPA